MHRKREQNRSTSQRTCGLCTWDISWSYLLDFMTQKRTYIPSENPYQSGNTQVVPSFNLSSLAWVKARHEQIFHFKTITYKSKKNFPNSLFVFHRSPSLFSVA
jgi:hypothetical protein